jgi:NADPH2:quinone reductase
MPISHVQRQGRAMKAVLCKEYCTPEGLALEELPDLTPGPGQVVVQVKACGINFLDSLIIQGKYQSKPPMPFSPGAEAAGVIKSVGEGVTGLQPGTRVLAFCGWGGYAEELLVDAAKVVAIPDEMDMVSAAAFMIIYATSHHALKDRARLQPGETLLVLGAAGGVGLTAVELGKVMGARVIAAASSPEKLELCRKYGADELINYSTENLKDRVKELTGGKGVDVVYDPVGGAYAEPAVRSLAWLGRYLVVGFAAGDIPKIPINLLLLKSSAMLGVFWGTYARNHPDHNSRNMAELFDWYRQGKLHPHVSGTWPLEQAAEALQHVVDRKVLGKVVLTMGPQ